MLWCILLFLFKLVWVLTHRFWGLVSHMCCVCICVLPYLNLLPYPSLSMCLSLFLCTHTHTQSLITIKTMSHLLRETAGFHIRKQGYFALKCFWVIYEDSVFVLRIFAHLNVLTFSYYDYVYFNPVLFFLAVTDPSN